MATLMTPDQLAEELRRIMAGDTAVRVLPDWARQLHGMLTAEETILDAHSCILTGKETGFGLLVLTGSRLLWVSRGLFNRTSTLSILLRQVSSVQHRKAWGYYELMVATTGAPVLTWRLPSGSRVPFFLIHVTETVATTGQAGT